MSAILARVLEPLPVPGLRTLGLRAQLKAAERAVDRAYSRRESLALDRAVLAYEADRDHQTTRGVRRAA